MNTLIKKVEAKHKKDNVNQIAVGNTVKAELKVKEGEKERIQVFEGVVIAISGTGISKSFIVRKISFGIGVEKKIPFHSPVLNKLTVVKKGKVRRAKLYYFRERLGKALNRLKIRQDK
ncbi:MAG TPA: 50S ribosomal protein L19 [Spirochaetota bacterium]|nr:50S ribosomal protein L19 [Spirochaetota bacterium]